MAYNNQYYTTYSTKRIPFVGNPEQRTGASITKDQIFINFFAEATKGPEGSKYFLEQRAGLVYQLSTATGEGRGIYYWNGNTFSVIGNTLYRNSTAVQVLSTSTGHVGFQEFANNTNQSFLIVLDGISGWVLKTDNTITKITSANFPTPHVVNAGYIDGYLVVAKAGTADLYNSNLLDPLTWTAGDFITAETFPDPVLSVCRQNNYIVAIGTQTTEFFYDAGTFPGTPLARNSAALHQIGTPAPDTMAQIEEQIVFVGQTQTGGRTVWVFNGFNPNEIGNEPVRQSLDYEGANIVNAKAFCIRSKGHKFYVLNLTGVTWVFDFDSQMWHQWANYTGAAKFNCDYASDYSVGYPLVLDRTAGYVYVMTEGISKDATGPTTTANITSIAISDKLDFGSMNHKFMHRFSLICDVPSGPFGDNQTSCTLYWTDNDYKTYSSGRTIQISDTMPTTVQLGIFRRRAFKLVYSDAYPMRLEGFEVDINVGSQ
jgi:hypothetical protein